MNNNETVNLISKIYLTMQERRFSSKTIESYRNSYNRLLSYLDRAKESTARIFSREAALEYIAVCSANKWKTLSGSYRTNLIHHIEVLVNFAETGKLRTTRINLSPKKLSYFSDIYNFYVATQEGMGFAFKTVTAKSYMMHKFLIYLENKGFKSFSNVTVKDIYGYVADKQTNSVASKERLLYHLREVCKLLSENEFCDKSFARLFPQISTHTEKSVPSCFNKEETISILSSVNRDTPCGKRDYAAILLAVCLGMRVGDILNLKYENIKWDSENIEFVQSKTAKFIQLTLTDEIKFALLDYMKNARIKSDSKYIFLSSRAPYSEYSNGSVLSNKIKKYMNDIELNGRKHGMHSLRFTSANNMLESGTGITTICNILGHTYFETTKLYLKIDTNQLKEAALDVEEIV